jgi:hypothetical protein
MRIQTTSSLRFPLRRRQVDRICGSHDSGDNTGSGRQKSLLWHWDGRTWSLAPSPNPTKGDFLDDVLFAGVAPSPGNLWIAGGEAEFVQGDPIFGALAIHSRTAASAIPY